MILVFDIDLCFFSEQESDDQESPRDLSAEEPQQNTESESESSQPSPRQPAQVRLFAIFYFLTDIPRVV